MHATASSRLSAGAWTPDCPPPPPRFVCLGAPLATCALPKGVCINFCYRCMERALRACARALLTFLLLTLLTYLLSVHGACAACARACVGHCNTPDTYTRIQKLRPPGHSIPYSNPSCLHLHCRRGFCHFRSHGRGIRRESATPPSACPLQLLMRLHGNHVPGCCCEEEPCALTPRPSCSLSETVTCGPG